MNEKMHAGMSKFISVNHLHAYIKFPCILMIKNVRILLPLVAGNPDRLKQNKDFTFPTFKPCKGIDFRGFLNRIYTCVNKG